MKKSLLALATVVGLLFGASTMPRGGKIEQAIILRELEQTRRFEFKDYTKYLVKGEIQFDNLTRGRIRCSYDFDDSWISDVDAIFDFNNKVVPASYKSTDATPGKYARVVYIDRDENGFAEYGYMDKDGDGYLEDKQEYK